MGEIRDITFRKYGADDYGALSEMIHALYREDPAGQPMDDAKIAATVAEYRQHPEKLIAIIMGVRAPICWY
jgi:hypothetical protein